MENKLYSLATLHEYGVPTKGQFKQYIHTVVFGDYQCLMMIKTGQIIINGNTYQMMQGYIKIEDIAKEIKKDQKYKCIKQVTRCARQWQENSNKYIKNIIHSEANPLTISIEGSKEIQGTYFRHDISLNALEYLCPQYKEICKNIVENSIIEQNQQRSNLHTNEQQQNQMSNGEKSQMTYQLMQLGGRNPNEQESDQESKEEENEQELYEDKENRLNQQLAELTIQQQKAQKQKKYKNAYEIAQQITEITQELLKLAKLKGQQKEGHLYLIYEKSTGDCVYAGKTEQEAKNGYNSSQVRFQGHKQIISDINKQFDQFHIFMAGKVTEYMRINNILSYHSGIVDEVFETQQQSIKSKYSGDLDIQETKLIKQLQSDGQIIYNMNKIDIKRTGSQSRSNSRSNSQQSVLINHLKQTATSVKRGDSLMQSTRLQIVPEVQEQQVILRSLSPIQNINTQQQVQLTNMNILRKCGQDGCNTKPSKGNSLCSKHTGPKQSKKN